VWKRSGPMAVVSAGVLVLAAGFALLGSWSLVRRGQRLLILSLLLLAGLYGTYGAMTVLGRMNLRPGPATLASNSYYAYTAFALFVPPLFGAWQGAWRAAIGAVSAARGALLAGLVVLAFHGAEQIWLVNRGIAPAPIMRDTSRPIHAVNLFVKARRVEPDFSFAIDYDSSDYVPKAYGVRVTHAIFHRWISDEPKYWIAVRGGRAVLLPGRPPAQSGAVAPPGGR
jgi:hypothetical protein